MRLSGFENAGAAPDGFMPHDSLAMFDRFEAQLLGMIDSYSSRN